MDKLKERDKLQELAEELAKIVDDVVDRVHLRYIEARDSRENYDGNIEILPLPEDRDPDAIYQAISKRSLFVLDTDAARPDEIAIANAIDDGASLKWSRIDANSDSRVIDAFAALKKLKKEYDERIAALPKEDSEKIAALRKEERERIAVLPKEGEKVSVGERIAALQKEEGERIVALKMLNWSLRRARGCRDGLAGHIESAGAATLLAKVPSLERPSDETEEDDTPTKTSELIAELEAGILAAVRRAVDINGLLQRPPETLIRSLNRLDKWSEAGGSTGHKAVVPDPVVAEIALATEVAARDFVWLLADHIETFWQVEVRPKLPEATAGPDDEHATVRTRFPLEALRAAIHKSCDDLEQRLKKGGIAAFAGPVDPSVGPLQILATAVRYPMQFAALFTFIVLPVLAARNLVAANLNAQQFLKSAVFWLLPALFLFASYQAFVAWRVAKGTTLDSARRHLRTETSKTLKEIGDFVGAAVSRFLKVENDRIMKDVFAKAKSIQEIKERSLELHREAVRDAMRSRFQDLSGLQQRLEKTMKAAEGAARKTLADFQNRLTPPVRKTAAPNRKGRRKDRQVPMEAGKAEA